MTAGTPTNTDAQPFPEEAPPGAYPETSQRRIRPEDLLRGLLVGALVLLAGLVLANITMNEIVGRGTAYFLLAAAAGVALTALAYYRIEWVMLGYLAIVWVAVGATPGVVTGVSSGSGKGVALSQIGMSFLLVMWAIRGVLRGQFSVARVPLNRLLLLFLAFNIVSAYNGTVWWDARVARFYNDMHWPDPGGRTPVLVVVFEVFMRVLLAGAFWLFANNLRDAVWVRRASWLLLLPGVMVIINYLGRVPMPIAGYGVLQEIVVACTLFAWLLEPRNEGAAPRRGLRFLGWIALAVIIYQVFRMNINWVSGWFGLFVGLYFVAFLRSRRLFVALVIGGLCLYVAGQAFLQATVVHKVNNSGDLARFDMMRAGVRYALEFPLGIGPGNYRQYNVYFGQKSVWNTSTFPSAHGFYTQMLSELGFIGLILTVLFVAAGVIMVSRFYWRMPPGRDRTFMLGIAGMWVGICASSGIGDYLVPVYHNNGVNTMSSAVYAWMGLGIAVAYARLYGLVSDEKSAAPEAAIPSAAEYYPRRMGREPSRS